MSNWNHKQLDKIAEVSARYADDRTVPAVARRLFAGASSLAKNLSLHPRPVGLSQAFSALQVAADEAGMCVCGGELCSFLTCPLITDRFSPGASDDREMAEQPSD